MFFSVNGSYHPCNQRQKNLQPYCCKAVDISDIRKTANKIRMESVKNKNKINVGTSNTKWSTASLQSWT